jgi:hypothetical protein
METRTVDWDPFIVAIGPTIIRATLILTDLLADCAVDTEADIAHKDRAATRVVLDDIEDRGLFPLVLVVTIAHEVSNISVTNNRVSPGDILLRVRLGDGDIGGPLVNVAVVVDGKVREDDGEHVAADALDLAPYPTLGLVLVVTKYLHID